MSDAIDNEIIEEEAEIDMIVEDGTCVENANSYVTLDFADSYMFSTDHKEWKDMTENDKKALIIRATTYIDSVYSKYGWHGRRKFREQELAFPRVEIIDKDGFEVVGIPKVLKQAVCECAILAVSEQLFTTKSSSGDIKKEKVDVIETEYFNSSESSTKYISRYEVLDSMLSGLYRTTKEEHRNKKVRFTNMIGGLL